MFYLFKLNCSCVALKTLLVFGLSLVIGSASLLFLHVPYGKSELVIRFESYTNRHSHRLRQTAYSCKLEMQGELIVVYA